MTRDNHLLPSSTFRKSIFVGLLWFMLSFIVFAPIHHVASAEEFVTQCTTIFSDDPQSYFCFDNQSSFPVVVTIIIEDPSQPTPIEDVVEPGRFLYIGGSGATTLLITIRDVLRRPLDVFVAQGEPPVNFQAQVVTRLPIPETTKTVVIAPATLNLDIQRLMLPLLLVP